MAASFVGSVVSLDCGEVLGTYQGHVSEVDNNHQTITINKAFRNGVKCQVPHITLNAGDIKGLKIITTSTMPPKEPDVKSNHKGSIPPHHHKPISIHDANAPPSCKTPSKETRNNHTGSPKYRNSPSHHHRKSPNDPHRRSPNVLQNSQGQNRLSSPSNGYHNSRKVTENGYHGNHKDQSGAVENGAYRKRTNSASEQYERRGGATYWKSEHAAGSVRKRTNSASEQYEKRVGSTPRKIENAGGYQNRRRGPREDCFSAPTDCILDEFDFESNLALFDKQAVFEEIDKEIEDMGYPKVVRPNNKQPGKYKCDENVLDSQPVVYRQIQVPDSSAKEYVTDSGLIVPSVTYETRTKLLLLVEQSGLKVERQLELVGRSASEMVLQLLGGSHRLTPKNAHQRPNVVVLCGPHIQGAYGVNCARQLATHNVNVTVFVPKFGKMPEPLQDELRLYDLTDGKKMHLAKDLPDRPTDMIISALDSHENKTLSSQAWYGDAVSWANRNKASVLAVDPPTEGCSVDTKWSLGLCLPLSMSERCGQVYLADLGIPKKVMKAVGITYMSPFGHKFVVALHTRS